MNVSKCGTSVRDCVSGTELPFATSITELLMLLMGHYNYVVQTSGTVDGVSYILWKEGGEEYRFRGYPDFTLYSKGEQVANRILVVMGEVQSTNEPAVQNAIYAISNLSKTPRKELLVLTVYNNISVSLSVARLVDADASGTPGTPAESLGIVSLKYYITPHSYNLLAVDGVRAFASHLNYYITSASRSLSE